MQDRRVRGDGGDGGRVGAHADRVEGEDAGEFDVLELRDEGFVWGSEGGGAAAGVGGGGWGGSPGWERWEAGWGGVG